jgi:hypothetical protein
MSNCAQQFLHGLAIRLAGTNSVFGTSGGDALEGEHAMQIRHARNVWFHVVSVQPYSLLCDYLRVSLTPKARPSRAKWSEYSSDELTVEGDGVNDYFAMAKSVYCTLHEPRC